ncbi:hypothetical protein FQN55_003377 [Onygenales sp. PD_40]|nr:hypothetical protein FQN55_003377 [Onygenales sp. PD_40]KAK2791138.1 hypothetical protein FQN52_005094 [Onygenales sp. PD_12]
MGIPPYPSSMGPCPATSPTSDYHPTYSSSSLRAPAWNHNRHSRYYRNPYFQGYPRRSEWQHKVRPAKQQSNWNVRSHKRPQLRPSSSSGSSDDQSGAYIAANMHPIGENNPSSSIPQLVTPNTTSGKTFTEIMNRAYDLKKSPLCLGKKLGASTTVPQSPWLLRNPFNPFGSDLSSTTGSSSSSSNQSGKFTTLAGRLQQPYSSGEQNEPLSNSILDNQDGKNSAWKKNKSDSVTVAFGLTDDAVLTESEQFSQLLQIIKLHNQQSKDLTELVSKYMDRASGRSKGISSRVVNVGKFSTKPLRRRNQNSDGNLKVASLPGGGDSPDPPRDHQIPFKGHMIDRVDTGEGAERQNISVGEQDVNKLDPATTGEATIRDDQAPDIAHPNDPPPAAPQNRGANFFAFPVHGLPDPPILRMEESTFYPGQNCENGISRKRSRGNIDALDLKYPVGDLECDIFLPAHNHPACQDGRAKRLKLENSPYSDRQECQYLFDI